MIMQTRRRFLRQVGGTAVLAAAGRMARAAPETWTVLRICGSPMMTPLIARWSEAFRAKHPDVAILADLRGTATAQFGLQMGTADIAASGREIYPYEYYGIYRRSQLLTIQVPVAVGSFGEVGKSNAIGVFVHPDNPIRTLSLGDLDRIFGAERTGGWKGMEWDLSVAQERQRFLRRWGEVGLTGAWADRPIIPYGPPAVHPGGVSFFQTRVSGGADSVNEQLREYDDRRAMLAALAKDPAGIAYAPLGYRTAAVRPLPLAPSDHAAAVNPSPAHIADLSYPLARLAYLDIAPDDVHGDPASPRWDITAFLRFVLGEGQLLIAGTGYTSLPERLRRAAAVRFSSTP